MQTISTAVYDRQDVCCRYVQTEAYKAFRQTGKMQFPEFGTTVSPLKSMWLALLGLTGIGQGMPLYMTLSAFPSSKLLRRKVLLETFTDIATIII